MASTNFTIEQMNSFDIPAGYQRDSNNQINPFHFDLFNMGQDFSKDTLIMFANHPTEAAKYLILVNKNTGQRVRILFPFDWE